jgi:DNA-binding HxlR family transcriptional regulator
VTDAVTDAVTGPNAIGASLGLLGDEWTLLIVQQAQQGVRRYSQLQARLGIGPTVLAARLATLTDAGVLEKVPDGGRFAYELTRSGKELWALLLCIWAWEQDWVQGEALPTMRHVSCGEVFRPVLACAVCSAATGAPDVDIALGPSGAIARSVPTGSNRRRAGSARAEGPGLFPETMSLMGSRWSSALLGCAFLGARRFSEFEAMLGAPPNVVAERLRSFVTLGVLDGDYRLTAKGRAFFPAVATLVAWGERWHPAPDGPALVATHRACGADFVPTLRCSCCDGLLRRSDVAVEPAAVPVRAS